MKSGVLILLLAISILLTGCTDTKSTEPVQNGSNQTNSSSNEQGETVENDSTTEDQEENSQEDPLVASTPDVVAFEVVLSLKNKEMLSLSHYVHPSKGVRFSPYGYVEVNTDLIFTAQQVEQLMMDTTEYHWGAFDGSGDPIEMTFTEYYERFVYDQDYANPEQTSNNQRIGQGNTIDNSGQIYPNATIVEYHFSGFDPQYEGMDWRSLRIVLEEDGGNWYVVGIIHDEWTI